MGTMRNASAELLADAARRGYVSVRSRNGGGSGTVWSADGLVVTNHHVVPGERATVELHDGREFVANVMNRDPEHDLAMLKVPVDGLAPLERRAAALRPGELVFAMGNPWGERAVLTGGVVFASTGSVVRADVRLAPGNSGGPLIDAAARLAGINSMIAGGIAVAIPTEVIEAFAGAREPMKPGFLGIMVAPVRVPDGIAASFGGDDEGTGLMLTGVEAASPADSAGLLPGDLLLGVDGARGLEPIAGRLRAMRAGRAVRLSLLRGGKPVEVEAMPA